MDVSIIIVNYNTSSLLLDAVASIEERTHGLAYEIIVVDNNSNDDSIKLIEKKIGFKIKLILLSENIGFGKANNKGIEQAQGRNVLFLNPDTKLINNAIKILSDFLDNSKSTGACGGNLFDEDMKPANSFKRFFPSIKGDLNEMLGQLPEKLVFRKNVNFNYTQKPLKVAYIFGADLMVKKEVIDEVGTFNPLFFMYAEEAELCFRIINHGYNIMSIPNALIQHLEGKSFSNEKNNEKRIEMQEKGRFVFYALRYNYKLNILANYIYKMSLLFRIAILKLYNKKRASHMQIRFKKFASAQAENL